MKKSRKRKILIVLAGIFFFLLSLHILLNVKSVQGYAIRALAAWLRVEIKYNILNINGFTGNFEGSQLEVLVPKTGTSIKLENFSLAFNPFLLIFKKIHLAHLEASEINIIVKSNPQAQKTIEEQATSQVSKKEVALAPKIEPLFQKIKIDNAQISSISVELPGDKKLKIAKFGVLTKGSFNILTRTLSTQADIVEYTSPRFDFFVDHLETNGRINFDDESTDKFPIEFQGSLNALNMLLGLPKKPNPTVTRSAWDQSLTPILNNKYNNLIPTNKTFAYLPLVTLNGEWTSKEVNVAQSRLQAFDGVLSINQQWDRKSGEIKFAIKNEAPFKIALLPLGKARIRQSSFKNLEIALEGNGNFRTLLDNSIKGNLTITATENTILPAINPLELVADWTTTHGKVNITDLKGKLGDGIITGKGQIDIADKSIESTVKGTNIDAQTIIRLFSSIDIPGKAEVDGRIYGILNNPTFDLNFSSDLAGYESIRFGSFKGKLKIEDKNMSVTGNATQEGGSGTLDLKVAKVFSSSEQETNFKADFKNMPLRLVFQNNPNISGSLSGNISILRSATSQSGSGHIEATNILWFNVPLQKISGELKIGDKSLSIAPVSIQFNEHEPSVSFNKPTVFNFTEEVGYTFSGWILPTLAIEGSRLNTEDFFKFKLSANATSLRFISPALPISLDELKFSGVFEGSYNLLSPRDSTIKGSLTNFTLKSDEKNLELLSKSQLNYSDRKISFSQTSIRAGEGRLILDGPLGMPDNSNLKIRGDLDISQLIDFVPWLVDGKGIAKSDLLVTGSLSKSEYKGTMIFNDADLSFRSLSADLSKTNGTLKIDGNRYEVTSLKTQFDDSPLTLNGWIEWTAPKITAANLSIEGTEIPSSYPKTWHMLSDLDVKLTGSGGNVTLSGVLQIVEGLYFKDYSLSQFILKPIGVVQSQAESMLDSWSYLNLNLDVRSAGEINIRNNLADIILKGNVKLAGSVGTPKITGSIDVLEGRISILGLNFDDATGFASFNNASSNMPFIDFSASDAIQDFDVKVKIQGPADNLTLALESTPALATNDIISLITYGQTPDTLSGKERNLFSTTAAASQILTILQNPIEKATHLDILKLESDDLATASTNQNITRFSIGKKISDRFSFEFTTDLSFKEAQKGIAIEYEIYDNLLIKGIKDTGSQYHFDLTWRFEGY